jgi:hypothetical protein
MPLTTLQQIRYELGDVDVALPIMSDSEYEYFLEKNNNSVRRAALDAAKTILFKLSMKGDHSVDILSVKGSKAAEAYRMALQLYIKNPDLNTLLQNASGYAGGISLIDIQSNIDNLDNNIVQSPINPSTVTTTLSTDYFSV